MHWTTWKRSGRRRTGAADRSTSQVLLASPRDSRGFEVCPRHSAYVDVDEGDWQNNATMRFFDSRRLWHQEYVCGTRTSFHSVVGAYSTVCAKGPTHTPTKVRPAKSFRCLSPPKAGRGTKSTSAGREPASIRQ
ncbi:uncharacterized protein LOC144088402 isoform X1 [Stigmatopora argus]